MPDIGWYRTPGDPNSSRYWDGAAWTDSRSGDATDLPEFPDAEPAAPDPGQTQVFVPAPADALPATEAVPIVVAAPVVDTEEEYVESDPRDRGSRGAAFAALAVAVILILALLVWLLTKSDDPDKPYVCRNTDITITDWNDNEATFANGQTAAWRGDADPGSKEALDQLCADVAALAAATPDSSSTTLPTTTVPNDPTTIATTTQPTATSRPVEPTTAPPSADTPAGTAATIGDGLALTVTGVSTDGRALTPSDGAPPSPDSGQTFVVPSVSLTNSSGTARSLEGVRFELVDVSSGAASQPRSSPTAMEPLDVSSPVPAGGDRTGDLVFEVPTTSDGALVLQVTTSAGTATFELR